MNSNGQGSLEVLLISTAVIALAFFFGSTYLSTQNTTTALLIAKNKLTEKLNALNEPAIIESVHYEKISDSEIHLTVFTQPRTITDQQVNISDVQTDIAQYTSFSTVKIQLNPV